MTANRKSRGCDAALQIEIAASAKQYKANELGHIELNAEDTAAWRQLIVLAMVFDSKGTVVRMDPELSNSLGIVLDIDTGTHTLKAFIAPWQPMPQIPVVELIRDFGSVFDGDPQTDAVANVLSRKREVRTLLTDFPRCRMAAEDILHERQTRDAICLRHLEALQILTNWRGVPPKSADIALSIPRPKGEVAE